MGRDLLPHPLAAPHFLKIMFRLMHDDAREGDEGDEVRDRHEAVHDVGEDPDRLEL